MLSHWLVSYRVLFVLENHVNVHRLHCKNQQMHCADLSLSEPCMPLGISTTLPGTWSARNTWQFDTRWIKMIQVSDDLWWPVMTCDDWLTGGWRAAVCCSFRNRTGIWHNFKLALGYSKNCDQRHVHFVWPLLHWTRSWTWQSFTKASQCLAHDFGGCTAIDAATCTMSENTLALGSLGASKHLNPHLPLHACGEQLEHGLTCN